MRLAVVLELQECVRGDPYVTQRAVGQRDGEPVGLAALDLVGPIERNLDALGLMVDQQPIDALRFVC